VQGFELGRGGTGPIEVAIFGSASEGSADRPEYQRLDAESLCASSAEWSLSVVGGLPVRGYVSCVTDCPYDGIVGTDSGGAGRPAAPVRAWCYEIRPCTPSGMGRPETIDAMVRAVCVSLLGGLPCNLRDRALITIHRGARFGQYRAISCLWACGVFDAAVAKVCAAVPMRGGGGQFFGAEPLRCASAAGAV